MAVRAAAARGGGVGGRARLDQLPRAQHPERAQHARDQPRDGRLAGARVAHQHKVLGEVVDALLGAQPLARLDLRARAARYDLGKIKVQTRRGKARQGKV